MLSAQEEILSIQLVTNNKYARQVRSCAAGFSNTFDICEYNFLLWIERWYFCPCWAHKTRAKAQQKVNREGPRLIGKKTFLEKRNSENMKGLFWAAYLSKAMNRWNRNQFWNQLSIHKYNVLRWFEQWYFCPCLAHKTRNKAQPTVGPESPRLINFPAKMNKFRALARNFY
jgi:hypothetical protein